MLIWHKFRLLWKYYIFQSFLAGLAIFAIIFVVKDKFVVVASIGATAFICFAMPKAVSAQTRQVLGGYLIALGCGAVFTFVPWQYYIEIPVVVGLAIFLMVALDFEHPPAAGAVIAVTTHEVDWPTVMAILVSILVITQCHYFLRKFLRDLV